jgi:rod shape determining protein RodA
MERRIRLAQTIDWWIVALYLIMIIFGWFNVYGASYDYTQTTFWGFEYRSGKQLIWIACALVIAGSILLIDGKIYEQMANLFYWAMLLLLLVTIFIAPNIKGSHSWLVFGPISFQPAELAKLATALALGKFISKTGFSMGNRRDAIGAIGLIMLPCILIILQSETGSALVFFAFFLMLYREGLPGVFLMVAACMVVLFLIIVPLSDLPVYHNVGSLGFMLAFIFILVVVMGCVIAYEADGTTMLHILGGTAVLFAIAGLLNIWFDVQYQIFALIAVIGAAIYLLFLFLYRSKRSYIWVALFAIGSVGVSFSVDYFFDHILEPHQQTRIKVVLGMEKDPKGVGYNVNQSKIAIGSGGWVGKGFLNGTQTKLKYVPEQDTDFIYCTIGEEHGFVGAAGVLCLFGLLFYRIMRIAENQRDTFTRVYAYSIVSIMLFHVLINVGMVLGITPVIGIPLPFFSYGGSSLWSFTVMLFVLLRLDMTQKVRFR